MPLTIYTPLEVLTAQSLNDNFQVAAQEGGLEQIQHSPIGILVNVVTVTQAFSSDYDNYRITISGGVASGDIALQLRFGAVAAGYFSSSNFTTYATPPVNTTLSQTNLTFYGFAGLGSVNGLNGINEINGPNLAERTFITSQVARASTTGLGGTSRGFLNDALQHDAFTIFTSSGTISGGFIDVYGYKK